VRVVSAYMGDPFGGRDAAMRTVDVVNRCRARRTLLRSFAGPTQGGPHDVRILPRFSWPGASIMLVDYAPGSLIRPARSRRPGEEDRGSDFTIGVSELPHGGRRGKVRSGRRNPPGWPFCAWEAYQAYPPNPFYPGTACRRWSENL